MPCSDLSYGDLHERSAVPGALDRLKAALADRYAIEHELGSGGRTKHTP